MMMNRKSLEEILRSLFHRFPSNLAYCFRGYNILFHATAVMLTVLLVTSGFDWTYFSWSKDHTYLQIMFFPAVVMGGLFPIIYPAVVYRKARKKKSTRKENTAFALGQAGFASLFISSFYKAITGRPPPELFDDPTNEDISREFRFGFMRGGIFHGWPSGHATSAFALAFTLITLYPDNRKIRNLALAYAFYVGIGVSTNIHWFSDFVAGALIGPVIGITVGKSFLKRYETILRKKS